MDNMSKVMNSVKIIEREPAFTVSYYDYNNSYSRDVSWRELENAKVGDTFSPIFNSFCGRDVYDETATVLYKDAHGILVRFVVERTADSPEGEELPSLCKIEYFKF